MTGPRPHRVLVVEDDSGVRELIASHLRKAGFDVETASSAESVLDRLRRER